MLDGRQQRAAPLRIRQRDSSLLSAVRRNNNETAHALAVIYEALRHTLVKATLASACRGLQRLLIGAAELLGTGGTIAVGVVLALLVVAWAVNRIIHRPERKVWLPTPG